MTTPPTSALEPLLPCPFCGSSASIYKSDLLKSGFYAECPNKNCILFGEIYLPEAWNTRTALHTPTVCADEVVTVEDISKDIQTWKFSDEHDGAFGTYLLKKYPNGVKIVAGDV